MQFFHSKQQDIRVGRREEGDGFVFQLRGVGQNRRGHSRILQEGAAHRHRRAAPAEVLGRPGGKEAPDRGDRGG